MMHARSLSPSQSEVRNPLRAAVSVLLLLNAWVVLGAILLSADKICAEEAAPGVVTSDGTVPEGNATENESPPEFEETNPFFFSSPCEFKTYDTPTWPVLCLMPAVEAATVFNTSSSRDHFDFYGWSLYAGLHVLSFLSLHYEDEGGFLEHKNGNPDSHVGSERRQVYAEIGNSVSSKLRFMMGRFNLPFGLGVLDMPLAYRYTLQGGDFWANNHPALQATIDNLVDARFDLAIARHSDSADSSDPLEPLNPNMYSLRSALDFSALEGTRLILSYLDDKHFGVSQVGAALLSVALNGDESSAEWVRRSADRNQPFSSDEQFIRFGFRQAMSAKGRGLAFYESMKDRHRLINLGYERDFFQRARVSFIMTFRRNLIADSEQVDSLATLNLKVEI